MNEGPHKSTTLTVEDPPQERSNHHRDPWVQHSTTIHPLTARGPRAKQYSNIALYSRSSAFQSANPTRGTVESNYETLTPGYNFVSSTPYSVSSTHYSVSPTPKPLSSTPSSLSSTPFSVSSSPPSLTSNPKPSSPTSRPLSPTLSNLINESLNSAPKTISSTPRPEPPSARMLNPASPSLSSTLELVTTTHIPTTSPRPPPSLEPSTSTSNPTTRTSDLAGNPQQPHVSKTNLTSTSVTPSESPQHRSNLTSEPTSFEDSTTHRSTQRARNITRLHPAKRRPPKANRTSRSSTSEVEPLGPPAKKSARVDPYKKDCSNDPCGPGVACQPTPGGEYEFECLCRDDLRIRPGGSCSNNHLEYDPLAKTLEFEANKEEYGPPARATEIEANKTTKNFVGFAAVVGTLVVMVLLLLVYWRRKSFYSITRHRKGEKKSTQQSPGALAKSSSLLRYNFASNPNYYAQSPDNLPLHTLAVQLIDSEQITFIGELGEGCFGKVYKGTFGPRCPENVGVVEGVVEGSTAATVNLTVAVKVLKECAGLEAKADFLREVEIMSAFRHENILSLIGIVATAFPTETGGTPWMVFEYMPYGDLAEVLRSCNKQFYSNDSPIKSLSKEDLLNISVQIASGMEYLSSQHFVHRDLACRNCLVGDKLTVKISDFGMSRDVYTCDYYKVGGSRMLPVRWMAHESIMYGKFTLESDVWSFGVVLWEIYSFGKQPYYGNSNENVVKLIFQGILLSPPDTCPPQVCDVMRRCWATDPNDRLKFPDILSKLKRLQQEQKGTSSSPSSPVAPPITYSELCPQDEGGLHLDSDQYLMPRKAEYREYLTVLNDV